MLCKSWGKLALTAFAYTEADPQLDGVSSKIRPAGNCCLLIFFGGLTSSGIAEYRRSADRCGSGDQEKPHNDLN